MADPDFITNHPITRAVTNGPCEMNIKIQIAAPGVVFRQAGQERQVVPASSAWTYQAPPFLQQIDIEV